MPLNGLTRQPALRWMMVALLISGAMVAVWIYSISGWYGFNVILRRGMTTWATVTPTDPRLPPPMRLALSTPPPDAAAGHFDWRQLLPGFEVAELPVMAAGVEADRILLVRVAPAHFKFEVMSQPAGNLDIDDWLARTGAALVVNGSFYAPTGLPATPVVADKQPLGPMTYDARHGAFIATDRGAGLHDFAGKPWQAALSGADQAMVSFPLLIGTDGASRADKSDRRWLANRSFVAEDAQGRIVIGTTREAFFSLDRLAEFLRAAPLHLRLALNLDGGPPACQAIAAAGYHRSFCGKWETQVHGGEIRLLGHLVGERRWGLPLVLVARPRVE